MLLKQLWVDDKEVPQAGPSAGYTIDEEGALYLPASLLPEEAEKQFVVKSVVSIHPKKNLKLSGLYASNELLCTQCEAEGFRRITFFLDRPDVMSLYTVIPL